MQRMRALRGVVSTQVPGIGAGVEYLRVSSGALHRAGLHRLRHLFLLLPGTGRDYRVPRQGESKGARAGARRRACDSSVKVTLRWSRALFSPGAAPTTDIPSLRPAKSPRRPRSISPRLAELLFKRRVKSPPSTWSTEQPRLASAP